MKKSNNTVKKSKLTKKVKKCKSVTKVSKKILKKSKVTKSCKIQKPSKNNKNRKTFKKQSGGGNQTLTFSYQGHNLTIVYDDDREVELVSSEVSSKLKGYLMLFSNNKTALDYIFVELITQLKRNNNQNFQLLFNSIRQNIIDNNPELALNKTTVYSPRNALYSNSNAQGPAYETVGEGPAYETVGHPPNTGVFVNASGVKYVMQPTTNQTAPVLYSQVDHLQKTNSVYNTVSYGPPILPSTLPAASPYINFASILAGDKSIAFVVIDMDAQFTDAVYQLCSHITNNEDTSITEGLKKNLCISSIRLSGEIRLTNNEFQRKYFKDFSELLDLLKRLKESKTYVLLTSSKLPKTILKAFLASQIQCTREITEALLRDDDTKASYKNFSFLDKYIVVQPKLKNYPPVLVKDEFNTVEKRQQNMGRIILEAIDDLIRNEQFPKLKNTSETINVRFLTDKEVDNIDNWKSHRENISGQGIYANLLDAPLTYKFDSVILAPIYDSAHYEAFFSGLGNPDPLKNPS